MLPVAGSRRRGLRVALAVVATAAICVATRLPAVAQPDVGQAHYRAGLAAKRRGDLRTAAGELERAVAADPGNAAARSALGWTYAGLGRRQDAAQELRAAAGLRPGTREARTDREAAERLAPAAPVAPAAPPAPAPAVPASPRAGTPAAPAPPAAGWDPMRLGVLAALGLLALGFRPFVVLVILGGLAAAGVQAGFRPGWPQSVLIALTAALCLPLVRVWLASLQLALISALLIALPAAAVSHFGLGSAWPLAAGDGAVLALLLPAGVIRTLLKMGVIRRPAAETSAGASGERRARAGPTESYVRSGSPPASGSSLGQEAPREPPRFG